MTDKKIISPENFRKRLQRLLTVSGLELSGFSEFTGVSESHLYSLLNGTREITYKTANKIAAPFDVDGSMLLKPSFKIDKKFADTKQLLDFYKANKGVHKYFANTRVDREASYFIQFEVLSQKQFNLPFTAKVVRLACAEAGRKFTSKRVAQVLEFLVMIQKLRSRKERITKKDGKLGNRLINVYSKN
ncbi:MAG TPA: helix-turn-helix transcriptional regulator [Niabella sp.]|nr:helix-turn-helix transcriptional regulator [Niabella sp.]